MSLPVGTPAPNFTLRGNDGQPVTLSSYQGRKNVLLLFLPAAFSATCTSEVCQVRDELPRLDSDDLQILAISTDSAYSLAVWAEREGLDYPLLSDFWPHGKVATDYGVFYPDAGIALRGTFLVDIDGIIRYSDVVSPLQARDRSVWQAAVASAA